MDYAVYGAGSLGLIFSAFLAKNGEKFDLIDRNTKSISAIKEKGIKVCGKVDFVQNVSCCLDTEVEKKYDIIFLYTKQINNVQTIEKIAKFLKEDGVICTMQNGLPEKDVAKVIGDKRAYGCAVGWGATRLEPGVSELTSENERACLAFSYGSFDGHKDAYLEEIGRILNVMGDAHLEENFIGARWAKLLINSAFSGLSAVTGATFGEVAKRKDSRKIAQLVIKECIDVAKAAKIKIEPVQGNDIAKLFDYSNGIKKAIGFMIIPIAMKKHASLKASMLQDIEKGIPCEIDSINGIASEYGVKYNTPTPMNDKIIEIIHKIEAKELKPSFDNIKLF
ncbi:MAG: ketopantoate reductase family protein [Clostridia bacterium]|nr:ketopantoate reductase family protein [Clostridia bacterium]